MGRRKGKVAQMGNSVLLKEKARRQGPRQSSDSFLHTTDLQDGTNYNRINFQSVTEQSNLEDFLNTAEMAGRDFTAERQNISVIMSTSQGIRLTADDMNKISKAQDEHKALLQIPRRPHWNEFTTKEELILSERDTFTDWRRQLKLLEEQEHIELTPYEKNLDFWRQLWRVIERSDVIVQIVDARNPLLFRCEDLETYTKEVNPQKTVMLLVNKADYLTEEQRSQWVTFFNQHGIQAVFFSAKTEQEKQEVPDEDVEKLDINVNSDSEESDDDEDDEEDEGEREDEYMKEEQCLDKEEEKLLKDDETSSVVNTNTLSSTKLSSPTNNCDDSLVNTEKAVKSPSSVDESGDKCIPSESAQTDKSHSTEILGDKDSSGSSLMLENKPDIVTADELLDIFRKLAHPSSIARSGDVKTVGMVGYPNVGKSSTINVILHAKKLAVSATPGRTKHLQTLYVDKNLMLCDCPGLVFPSFIATKAHLVINGILPIDELRDHVSPVSLICDHIPRNVLEATYSIMIPQPSIEEEERPPTAEELLNAYGGMRGFMTARGIPDGPRASRYLLKDFVTGKLLYCNPPPGINGVDFQDKDRILKIEADRTVVKAAPPKVQSAVDKDFFQKRDSKIHAKGVHRVKDFVRVDCLRPTGSGAADGGDGSSASGSIAGSTMSLNSCGAGVTKPWRMKNNRNKKEKLRRLHRDLDVH